MKAFAVATDRVCQLLETDRRVDEVTQNDACGVRFAVEEYGSGLVEHRLAHSLDYFGEHRFLKAHQAADRALIEEIRKALLCCRTAQAPAIFGANGAWAR